MRWWSQIWWLRGEGLTIQFFASYHSGFSAIKCCCYSTRQKITRSMVNGIIVQRSMLPCMPFSMSSLCLGYTNWSQGWFTRFLWDSGRLSAWECFGPKIWELAGARLFFMSNRNTYSWHQIKILELSKVILAIIFLGKSSDNFWNGMWENSSFST